MRATLTKEFSLGASLDHGPNCTQAQARQLLEELRAAYQLLLPAERSVIEGIVSQSARMRFTQEMSEAANALSRYAERRRHNATLA